MPLKSYSTKSSSAFSSHAVLLQSTSVDSASAPQLSLTPATIAKTPIGLVNNGVQLNPNGRNFPTIFSSDTAQVLQLPSRGGLGSCSRRGGGGGDRRAATPVLHHHASSPASD